MAVGGRAGFSTHFTKTVAQVPAPRSTRPRSSLRSWSGNRSLSGSATMSSHHSQLPRGLNATRSPLYQGRFGRMFSDALPGVYGSNTQESEHNLSALADAMTAELEPPKDGPDAEEGGIPALYTYFVQFIDH